MQLDRYATGTLEVFETLPEVLLPTQMDWGGRLGLALGERRLLWAMLLDAAVCFSKYRCARDNGGRKLFREAERWIRSRDDRSPFSFPAVCDVLGLNARQVRINLLESVYGKFGESTHLGSEDRRLGERRSRQQRPAAGSRGARRSGPSPVRMHRPRLGERRDSSARTVSGRR